MEWKKARKRVFRSIGRRWDSCPASGVRWDETKGELQSIFLSEILDRIKAVDIFDMFSCHGDVLEMVIPPRKNKQGKRCDFCRFARVEDAWMLAVRLDNIRID